MLFLGNSLKQAGYKVVAYHLKEDDIELKMGDIDFSTFLFVGVCSIMTGYSLRAAMKLSEFIKNHGEVPIVWGGVQPSIIPELCLQKNYVDFVGLGYGEELIVEIARMLEGEMKPEKVAGLAYRSPNGECRIGEIRKLEKNLDCYHADYSLVDVNDYINNGTVLGVIMSSRGCPFNCAFCYNQYFSKRVWRAHSCEYVMRVLTELKEKYSFSEFSFSDDNFFVDNKRAIKILGMSHDLGLRVCSLDIKINNIKEDDIVKIGKYKVTSIFFGTESLNNDIIEYLGKEQTKDMVIDTLKKFSQLAPDVRVQTEILVGLTAEYTSDMKRDVADGIDLYNYNKNFSLYFGNLVPLPGTKMFELALSQNIGFKPSKLEDYVALDISNAHRMVDKWAILDSPKLDKKHLGYVERYSALLDMDRRNIIGFKKKIRHMFFKIACYRLKNWQFTFASLDFFFWKISVEISKLFGKFSGEK
ncbi:MAG: radical SAM protein [Synergistaceae bacterium]|jgi:radical SAM superfamily enzyme YgiQ (UPF0313 family)|nr:radical SAM protein [Synergistaceae bacterium]